MQGGRRTSTSASMMHTAWASPCWKGRPSGRTSTTPMSYFFLLYRMRKVSPLVSAERLGLGLGLGLGFGFG